MESIVTFFTVTLVTLCFGYAIGSIYLHIINDEHLD
jgi:hypothetical protein